MARCRVCSGAGLIPCPMCAGWEDPMPVPDPELGPVPPPGAYFRHGHRFWQYFVLLNDLWVSSISQAKGLPLCLCDLCRTVSGLVLLVPALQGQPGAEVSSARDQCPLFCAGPLTPRSLQKHSVLVFSCPSCGGHKHNNLAQAGRCAGVAGALPGHPAAEEEARAAAAHASAARRAGRAQPLWRGPQRRVCRRGFQGGSGGGAPGGR